jgi:hypothetical protein
MFDILLWYVIVSYVFGLALFIYEVYRATRSGETNLLWFGIILLFLSPLTAWHGVLHYMAVWWHRFNGTPFEPWI